MKKGITVAMAFASLMLAKNAKAIQTETQDKTPIKKEIKGTTNARRRKGEKPFTLEPTPPMLNDIGVLSYNSPFFNPTRSQRIKNKLNRKYYGKR